MIPIKTLAVVIDHAKLKSKEIPVDFVKNYNAMLDILYDTCKSGATKNNLVYPQHLKQYISEMKKQFTSAIS
jgi:hypothetical protein